jgi:ABC-type multidrug transport system permease subunit
MPKIGLSRKFILFLILATVANGLFILYLFYKQNGHLQKAVMVIVIVLTIFFCSVILIFEYFFR